MDYLQYLNKQPTEIENITIEIKEGTLTRTGATVIITDLSKKINTYSNEYRIDQKMNGRWKILKGNGSWSDLVPPSPDRNNQIVTEFNWESEYGELKPGEYRIATPVNSDYIAVEFTIK